MKAQEELNTIMLEKIHNEEKDKIRILIRNFLKLPRTINVRVGKWNFPAITMTLQVKSQLNITEKLNSEVKSVTKIKRRKGIDPMRKYLGNSRKLNHQCLMGKSRRERRQRPGCPK